MEDRILSWQPNRSFSLPVKQFDRLRNELVTVYPLIKQAGVAYKKQAAQLDTNAIYLGICTVNPQITHKCT